jgi:hypothetical protein
MDNELREIYIRIYKIIEVDYPKDYSERDLLSELENKSLKFACSDAEAKIKILMSNLIGELKKGERADKNQINQLVKDLENTYKYSKYFD